MIKKKKNLCILLMQLKHLWEAASKIDPDLSK